MPTKKTRVKEVTSHVVPLAGALTLRDGDRVGEHLAKWTVSSPQDRRNVAMCLAQPSCVHEVQEEAINKYASEVLPPDERGELILNLCAPKSAWHPLSEVYPFCRLKCTAATRLPSARPIYPERAF